MEGLSRVFFIVYRGFITVEKILRRLAEIYGFIEGSYTAGTSDCSSALLFTQELSLQVTPWTSRDPKDVRMILGNAHLGFV